jgi:hypothetical protein
MQEARAYLFAVSDERNNDSNNARNIVDLAPTSLMTVYLSFLHNATNWNQDERWRNALCTLTLARDMRDDVVRIAEKITFNAPMAIGMY